MASAYSKPTQYSAPVPTKDVNLINQVLAAKQQRFDVNTARIEEAVSAVSSVDLLRDTEKEELKGRLNNLLTQVSKGSKLDLTDNNTARQLRGNVMSVIDDDLMKHVGIAKQKKAFDQRMLKLKEEDPEKYNESNLQNAYYEAGFSDYMNEKEDSFSQLQYNPYYDLNENLNKPLEDYAKSLGFVKDIDEEGNEYFIRTEKTEELGEEKIKNFIQLRVQQDPRLRKQLQINARAGVGFNMDYAKQDLLSSRDSSVKRYEKEREGLKIKIKETGNEELKASLQNELEYINSNLTRLKNKTFDTKDSVDAGVTTIYTQSLIDQYAKTYAKKDKTDVDYTNINKLMNKGNSGSKKGPGTSAGALGGAGTRAVIENQQYEDQAPKIGIATIENKVVEETQRLKDLMVTSDPTLKTKTPEELTNLVQKKLEILRDNGFDIKATDGMSAEEFTQLKLLDQAEKNLTKTYQAIDKEIAPRIEQMYEGIFGMKGNPKLKMDNLAQTMPVTVAMVKNSKNYNNLSDSEKRLVNSEMALAIAQQEGGETAEYLKPYAENQASGIDPKEILPKGIAEQVEKNKEMADASWWGGMGKAFLSGTGFHKNVLEAGMSFLNPFTRPRQKGKNVAIQFKDMVDSAVGFSQANREVDLAGDRIDREWLTEDSELEDLELDDLAGNVDYDSLFGSAFKQSLQSAVVNPLEEAKQNFVKENAVVFNPEIDMDESIVNSLDSVMFEKARQRNTYVPMKGTKFSVMPSADPSKVTISYQGVTMRDREDGKSELKDTNTTTIDIPREDLLKNPALQNLGEIVSKNAGNWEMSAKNPTEFEQPIPYTTPKDYEDAKKLATTFTRKFKRYLTPELEAELRKGNVFPTYMDNYNNAASTIKDPNQLAKYEKEVLKNHYKIVYTRMAGQFIPELYAKPKGVADAPFKEIKLKGFNGQLTEDFDIYNYSLLTSKLIQMHINEQIKDYR